MRLAIKFFVSVAVVAATAAADSAMARGVQNPPAPAERSAGQQPPAGGRGGGRGNPGLALYADKCAGCHGTADGQAGRAPRVFDQKWMDSTTDETLTKAIRTGAAHAQAGLGPGQFTDDQLFQTITFIRTQTANLTPKPEFVANADGQVITSEKQRFKIEVLTKGLETPWGLAFLPDGRLLITERPGRLRIYDKGKLSEPMKGTPVPHVQQDGGYLDVTVHPQYARNGWIYLSYSEVQPGFVPPPASEAPTAQPAGQGRGRGPQIPSNTVIVRGKLNKNNEWTDQQVIFRSPSTLYVATGVHFGSRFLWDKQSHLFFTLGERGTMENAQDLKNPLGKIHRVNDDGSIPKDNPFVSRPDALGSVWSYGHRNPQGLAWDPVTGKLWESEHGPNGGDEINVIEPGHNYGWGVISMGAQAGITERAHAGMEQPIVYFTPSIGPSGITFYAGSRYPGWKNTSLFVCGLIGQQLRRLDISGTTVTHQEVVMGQFGRVHGIVTGPDGYFYVALQNPTAGTTGITMSASTPGQLVRFDPRRQMSARLLTAAVLLGVALARVSAFQTPTAPAQTPPVVIPTAPPAAPVYSKLPGNPWPPVRKAGTTSPALTPAEEMQTFSVPPGYHVELVAAEPLVDSPIAIDFDADGRLWVLETPAFLPDTSGRDSREPINRVVVLEDTNGDGTMDKRTVYADGLVMPRALKVLDRGMVLVGEPPNLWLMKDTNGDLKSDTKDLIANTYGNGNAGIEHNANSLLWAMDNIMYSSEHTSNLRMKPPQPRASGSERAGGAERGNGAPASTDAGGSGGAKPPGMDVKFESLPTLSRGQWQISQDDAGRIYRNVNDSPLYVDYTPGQYFLRNPNSVRTRGLYEILIEQIDATVYPVRNNRGVNRGYRDEYFRADGSSTVIQGAGGPIIYRGDKYPKTAQGNAFISDSPTNLVHQMVITDDGAGRLSAKNAYPRGEFFASSDERCRPVNLYSAPDGNMYVVDMYRGVVQAGGIWSEYLTQYIRSRELLLPVSRGRIWRVVYGTGPNRRGPKPALSSATPAQLVQTLSHPNGWWRDTAQQLLVQRGETSVAPALKQLSASAPDWRTKLHALWTLDGLDQIDPATVEKALMDPSPDVRAAGVRLSERWLGQANQSIVASVLKLTNDRSWNVRRQLAASIGELSASSKIDAVTPLLLREGSDPIVVDAALGGLKGQEADVLSRVLQASPAAPPSEAVSMLAAAVAKSSDVAGVQRVIDRAADASRPVWERTALLRGLDAGLPAPGAGGRGGRGGGAGGGGLPGLSTPGGRVTLSAGRGVTLQREPAVLIGLSAGSDAIALAARAVVAKLDWTGKPAPAGPVVPPLSAEEQRRFDAGKEVFTNLCAGCHQADGQGKEKVAPSLVTSKYVQANPQILIRILVGGKEGPVGLMPPLAGALSDAQIAAALTYIRREWGHTAAPVAEIDVRELRQSTSFRKTPWTETELSGMLAGGRGRGGGN